MRAASAAVTAGTSARSTGTATAITRPPRKGSCPAPPPGKSPFLSCKVPTIRPIRGLIALVVLGFPHRRRPSLPHNRQDRKDVGRKSHQGGDGVQVQGHATTSHEGQRRRPGSDSIDEPRAYRHTSSIFMWLGWILTCSNTTLTAQVNSRFLVVRPHLKLATK